MDEWNFLLQKFRHILLVLFHIFPQFIKPFFPILESGNRCLNCKSVRFCYFVGVELSPHSVMQNRVFCIDGSRLQPCQIKCLRRRNAGNTDVPAGIIHRGKRNVFCTGFCQITVNFIRDNNDIILLT